MSANDEIVEARLSHLVVEAVVAECPSGDAVPVEIPAATTGHPDGLGGRLATFPLKRFERLRFRINFPVRNNSNPAKKGNIIRTTAIQILA